MVEQAGLAVQPDTVRTAPAVAVTATVPLYPVAHDRAPTAARVTPATSVAATTLALPSSVVESRISTRLQQVSVSVPVAP